MGQNALIIDDSFIMRARIQTILKEAGYTVTDARTGKEGLEKVNEMDQVDLILVDWHMPEMSGIDFVKSLREIPEFQKTPVLMVTAELDESMVEQAKQAGVDAYLTKPFKKEDILQELKKL